MTVHLDCCYDEGMYSGTGKRKRWICAVCDVAKGGLLKENQRQAGNGKATANSASAAARVRGVESRPVRTAVLLRKSIAGDSSDCLTPPDDWKRPLHPCIMCNHLGGAMSPVHDRTVEFVAPEKTEWIHELCRILCYDRERKATNCDMETCAICGTSEGGGCGEGVNNILARRLARCAARDCQVTFHPMCARIANEKTKATVTSWIEKDAAVRREQKKSDDRRQKLDNRNKKEKMARDAKKMEQMEEQRKAEKKRLANFKRRVGYKPGDELAHFSESILKESSSRGAPPPEPVYKSKLEKDGYDEDEWIKERNSDLLSTSEWPLRFAVCETESSRKDRNRTNLPGAGGLGNCVRCDGGGGDAIVPLMFCNLHHPSRKPALRGLNPGGGERHGFVFPFRSPPPHANIDVEKWKGIREKNLMIKERRRREREEEKRRKEEEERERLEREERERKRAEAKARKRKKTKGKPSKGKPEALPQKRGGGAQQQKHKKDQKQKRKRKRKAGSGGEAISTSASSNSKRSKKPRTADLVASSASHLSKKLASAGKSKNVVTPKPAKPVMPWHKL